MFPGRAYQFSFDGNEQVGYFEGNLEFRFDISATTFPVEMLPSNAKTLKKGKSYTINWSDFNQSGTYDIELLKSGQVFQVLETNYSGTSYTSVIPKSTAKGSDYAIRVTPSSDRQLASEPFPVKIASKSGLIFAILPAVVVGAGGAYYFLNQDDSGGSNSDDFPSPPAGPGGE
jgi:hypothetical protein